MGQWISSSVDTFKNFLSACMIFLAFVSSSLHASELDVTAYSDTEYSSNARLTKTDTESDVIESLGIDVRLTEDRKRFNVNANFTLEQEYYLNNTFSGQTNLTTGFGLFNFDIIEDFLDWRTSFTRTQVLSDSSRENTPDNRELRDIIRTGPTVNYRLNQISTLSFEVNYTQVENSAESAADTKRVSANASYRYKYNTNTDYSINSSYERVIETKQNAETLSNSDDQPKNINVNVAMNRRFSHGNLSLGAGRSQASAAGQEDELANFFKLNLQRDDFFSHLIQFQYSETISDSSIGFSLDNDESLIGEDIDNSLIESSTILDVVKQKLASVALSKNNELYQYNLSAFWSNLDYETQPNDESAVGFTFGVRARLESALFVGFTYKYENQELTNFTELGTNTKQTFTFDTTYQWTKQFAIDTFVQFQQQRNDKNPSREFENISTGISLKWVLY